jgi:PAS domain S-box-containing protein
MKVRREKPHKGIYNHLVWVGIVFIVLYWLIESAVHSYFFDRGSFLSHVIYPDGHELWMRLIVVALLIIFSLYGQQAINNRRRNELALIEREKDTQRILENNPAAIILVDCDSREIAYANFNALNLLEATPDILLGKKCHQFLCNTTQGKCPILDIGLQRDLSEREMITANGKIIPVLKNVTTIQYNGKPHLLEAFFDITRQKQMQQSLLQAHTELHQIFQTATVGMRLIDRNFNILKVNQGFSKLSGIAIEDAVGKKCFEVFAGNLCHTPSCSLQRVLAGKDLLDFEVTKIRSDGSPLICNLKVTRFEGADGIIGVVEAFNDITEFKRIQDELQLERDRLHRLLFHQFESVGIINSQYLLEYQNEMLEKFTQSKASRLCYEVLRYRHEPCNDCHMQQAFVSEAIQRFEFDTDSGSSYQHTYTPFVDNDGQKKVLISRRDITETKASIASALGSERLSALGELAAGVAHEINNPINSIINYAQILTNRTKTGDQLNTISTRIIGEGDRIAAIVASLLSFSRQENANRSLVSIRDLLQEVLTLTGAHLKKDGIKVIVNIDNSPPPISAATQEIEQIFLNIINNSRYALNEKYPHGGDMKRLIIDIGKVMINEDTFVSACFTDFGTGIPTNLIEKVVNPFFSTKPKGKGTGLGLSISHRIAENHGGKITINSIPDEFTKVTVELPAQYDK